MRDKKTVLSLVQPSGDLTIGNYLGAMKNFLKFQEEYDCYFGVADLHSITIPQVPKDLRKRTKEVLALYLAIGLDPNKVTVFVQSHVTDHLKLYWVLNSISYMGQLSRMTQFKEKSQKNEENLNAALFTYPSLMAADILIYNSDLVPVGEDQRQHLELARDLAERFNFRYSETFTVPEPLIHKSTSKIMSLKNPDKKMSKSDEDQNACIFILDEPKVIRKKIMGAVTDSEANFAYNDYQKGLKNLIDIYCAFEQVSPDDVVKKFSGKPYSDFKSELVDIIIKHLGPIQNRFKEFIEDKEFLESILEEGAKRASFKTRKMIDKVYRKVGFYQLGK